MRRRVLSPTGIMWGQLPLAPGRLRLACSLIHVAGEHKQEVRQAVEIDDDLRIHLFLSRQADDSALGAGARAPGEVTQGARPGPGREDKRAEARDPGVVLVYEPLQAGDLGFGVREHSPL